MEKLTKITDKGSGVDRHRLRYTLYLPGGSRAKEGVSA